MDLVVADLSRGSGTRLVVEAVESLVDEAPTPLTDGHPVRAQLSCDVRIGSALCTSQDDLRSESQRTGASSPRRQPEERRALLLGQLKRLLLRSASSRHHHV
jgi:hypothetical protein